MKFVQFVYNDKPKDIRVGYVECDTVIDLNKSDPAIPCTLLEILKIGCPCRLYKLQKENIIVTPMSDITLVAPITGVDKVLGLAMNYSDMCKEKYVDLPKVPVYFSKFASCIIGPNDAIKIRTAVAKKVDWEVELAVVMGAKCSNVTADYAMTFVFGYTIAQDVSSRDWQTQNGGQFVLGKAQDTFCPLGPFIVTADEVGDPHCLAIKCSVNGVVKQDSTTANLVHKIPHLIERLSS